MALSQKSFQWKLRMIQLTTECMKEPLVSQSKARLGMLIFKWVLRMSPTMEGKKSKSSPMATVVRCMETLCERKVEENISHGDGGASGKAVGCRLQAHETLVGHASRLKLRFS